MENNNINLNEILDNNFVSKVQYELFKPENILTEKNIFPLNNVFNFNYIKTQIIEYIKTNSETRNIIKILFNKLKIFIKNGIKYPSEECSPYYFCKNSEKCINVIDTLNKTHDYASYIESCKQFCQIDLNICALFSYYVIFIIYITLHIKNKMSLDDITEKLKQSINNYEFKNVPNLFPGIFSIKQISLSIITSMKIKNTFGIKRKNWKIRKYSSKKIKRKYSKIGKYSSKKIRRKYSKIGKRNFKK